MSTFSMICISLSIIINLGSIYVVLKNYKAFKKRLRELGDSP